ncbi:MAG: toll/interleukin-1 receptor domain-containing protein [Eubacteriales bacterium]
MEKYRVFISYSRKDIDNVQKIAKILEQKNLTPIWDKNFLYGQKFPEMIQNYIAHAHVFLPVITAESSRRGWVHQEIGYAMALHVPIMPISIGELPGEMISQFHAITLDDKLTGIDDLLTYESIKSLIENEYNPLNSTYCCTELAEDRAVLMVKLANDVIRMGQSACIRQKGGLSSYHIPNLPINDQRWGDRYNNGVQNNDNHCRNQLAERKILERHARESGCKLIVNTDLIINNYVKRAAVERLQTFLEFIEDMPDDKIDIAFNKNLDFNETITLVGDWFSCEAFSRTLTQGFKQAIFTRYAPGMRSKIECFDSEMDYLLKKEGIKAGESREPAIKKIKEVIDDVKAK